MLAIVVELLHGTLRASPDDTALAGSADGTVAEWPPSPGRLFAALVAGDGTPPRSRFTSADELRLLERAAPPTIYADGPTRVLHSGLNQRFVVLDSREEGWVQEYPARVAGAARPGARCSPQHATVTYLWPDVEPARPQLDALALRAARVGYLGCSDSPVRVRVSSTQDVPTAGEAWVPDATGDVTMPVPFDGLVDVLDNAFTRWTAGEPVRRSWSRIDRARYRVPGERPEPTPTVLWLRFGAAVSGRRVLAVTETLRAAVLDRYQAQEGDGGAADQGGVPAVLHGHGIGGGGYETACYLALPDVGQRYSRGRIHGAALWLPAETAPALIAGVRAALSSIQVLERRGVFRADVSLYDGEPRPRASHPDRWRRASSRWVSAFPVVHERFHRHGPSVEDVQGWCGHVGIDTPIVNVRTSRVPILAGAVSLRPHEVYRAGKERRPYSHLEITFADRVRGPFALGRSRQFGLGLMAQADPAESRSDG